MRSFVLLTFLITGCAEYIIRDKKTYTEEVSWFQNIALSQSKELRFYLGSGCTCSPSREWASDRCLHTARLILLVETRVPAHSQSMLGATPKTLPVIPEANSLCP